MRVLFTTTPGWGHIHPMVPLARAFSERGDEVAWAAAPEVAPRLEAAGFRTFPAGLGGAEAFAAVRQSFPEIVELSHRSTRRGFPMMFGAARTKPMLDDLVPIADAWKPSLIIHEQAELAGPIVAGARRIPHATHSFGQLVGPENLDPEELGVVPLWESQGLAAPEFGGCYAHVYLDIFPSSLHAADMAHIARRQPVRPVTFATGPDEALPEFIGVDSGPLIYVTFGTVFNENLAVIRTVVEGVSRLPARLVATLGPDADLSEFGEQPANVHVTRYVPQTQLLPHCAAVVSHGGSGTFLAALSEGLPQVCVPQGADQFANAEACAAGGVGHMLLPDEVTADSVCAKARDILSDDRFRRAASRVQAEIATMPHPVEVATVLCDSLLGS